MKSLHHDGLPEGCAGFGVGVLNGHGRQWSLLLGDGVVDGDVPDEGFGSVIDRHFLDDRARCCRGRE